MKITTFSIVSGGSACNARCPFCVARMTPDNGVGTKEPEVNWRNFRKACLLARQSNVTTVLVTGKGEPTLFPNQITSYLERLQEFEFPMIEMQTNGICIADGKVTEEHLQRWYDLGMTTIAISIVSYDPAKNHQIYLPYRKRVVPAPQQKPVGDGRPGTLAQVSPGWYEQGLTRASDGSLVPHDPAGSAPRSVADDEPDTLPSARFPGGEPPRAPSRLPLLSDQPSLGKELSERASRESSGYIDLPALIAKLHKPERRFSVRLSCILANGFIDSASELQNLLAFARENGVEQMTLIPVTKPNDSKDLEAFEWISQHHVRDEQWAEIRDFVERAGRKLMTLPHGAVIYDVGGQNLNLSNCLTVDADGEQIRTLIFFPDGHARYDWAHEGAILF